MDQQMYTSECEECGKLMTGYSENHAMYMLAQHKLRHQNEKRKKKEKAEDEN